MITQNIQNRGNIVSKVTTHLLFVKQISLKECITSTFLQK
ncbi:hypothetical protein BANRA_00290 [Acinetobacter baumannii]|nr:hypothetical protein BANRA_00290 [Acinetobacter baumannii]